MNRSARVVTLDGWRVHLFASLLVLTLLPGCGGSEPATDPDAGCAGCDEMCEPNNPEGYCPDGRVCTGGACIVDLDDGSPISTDVAHDTFDQIWGVYDRSYANFPTRSVNWDEVRDRYTSLIDAVTTQFQMAWLTTAAVAELGDAHTCAVNRGVCEAARGFGVGYSNIGACVREVEGRFLVSMLGWPNPMGFATGDELVAIDGRSPEQALFDLERQPRCSPCASSADQKRRQLVDSVMFRAAGDAMVTIRRALDGKLVDVPIQTQEQWTPCGEKVGFLGDYDAESGISSDILEGNILYIHLPAFSAYDPGTGTRVDTPVIERLRVLIEDAKSRAGVILDVRDNPGGFPSIYFTLASWLYATTTDLFRCQIKTGPAHDDLSAVDTYQAVPDGLLHYNGPLAVLVNARTMSAGDFMSAFLQSTDRARTFGAPSAGAFGSGAGMMLGSSWSLGYSNIYCTDLDGTPLEGNPPAVDVAVELSEQDLLQQTDPVIETARAWIAGS